MDNKYKYKKGNYAQDSTKGKSMLNPQSYKSDALVQVWMDSRVLATLSIWLDNNGITTRHMSDVIKFTLEQVLGNIVPGQVQMVEFTKNARELLERKYRVNLNPRDRGKKNVLHNMILDDRRMGVGEVLSGTTAGIGNVLSEESPNMPSKEEIQKHLDKIDQEENERNRVLDKEKIANMEVDEQGCVVIKRPEGSEETRSLLGQIKNNDGVVNSRPKPLNDEELDRKQEEREEREKKEGEEMDKMLGK